MLSFSACLFEIYLSRRPAKSKVNAALGDFVCLLDLVDCLICLFDFIGPLFVAGFPLVCLITTCLDMLVLLLVCIVSIGVRSLYAIVGCALSARGSSLKAVSLGPRRLCIGFCAVRRPCTLCEVLPVGLM